MATEGEKKEFLEKDLHDALKWLFVGAVAWHAPDKAERPHQKALGMFTTLVQARALYEFFYGKGKNDDARAAHFAPGWSDNGSNNKLYSDYMARETPANKRVFHLVFGRSAHSGGTGDDGIDHLKNQVLEFAKDIRDVSTKFSNCVEPRFRDTVQSALSRALDEAKSVAKIYGITSPF